MIVLDLTYDVGNQAGRKQDAKRDTEKRTMATATKVLSLYSPGKFPGSAQNNTRPRYHNSLPGNMNIYQRVLDGRDNRTITNNGVCTRYVSNLRHAQLKRHHRHHYVQNILWQRSGGIF